MWVGRCLRFLPSPSPQAAGIRKIADGLDGTGIEEEDEEDEGEEEVSGWKV